MEGNILIRVVKESGILLQQGPQIKQVLPMEKELFDLVREKKIDKRILALFVKPPDVFFMSMQIFLHQAGGWQVC